MLSENDLDEIVRRCAVSPQSAPPIDVAISAVPRASSMTATTARRMRQASSAVEARGP
jgi:hypothetical protein